MLARSLSPQTNVYLGVERAPVEMREGLNPEMPEAIEVLLGQMLAKNAAGRPADAAALLAALDTSDQIRLSPQPARPSTGGEQRLLSVLMAALPHGHAAPRSPESTITSEQLVELHRELSDLGARLEMLAGGALVATLRHARGAATDQAAQAVRCALLIKTRWPAAAVALSTGSGLADEQAPTGEVFDRAAALLRDHAGAPPSEQILLDDPRAARGALRRQSYAYRCVHADGRRARARREPAAAWQAYPLRGPGLRAGHPGERACGLYRRQRATCGAHDSTARRGQIKAAPRVSAPAAGPRRRPLDPDRPRRSDDRGFVVQSARPGIAKAVRGPRRREAGGSA